MSIKEKLNITKGTVEELTDLEKGESMNQLIVYLESEFPDSNFFFDVNLESLVETLEYNGFKEEEIIKLNKSMYGDFVSFTYYTDLEIYVLEVGVR